MTRHVTPNNASRHQRPPRARSPPYPGRCPGHRGEAGLQGLDDRNANQPFESRCGGEQQIDESLALLQAPLGPRELPRAHGAVVELSVDDRPHRIVYAPFGHR